MARRRLLCDLAVGQRLLQVGNACGGDPGRTEVEFLQVGQAVRYKESQTSDFSLRPVTSTDGKIFQSVDEQSTEERILDASEFGES